MSTELDFLVTDADTTDQETIRIGNKVFPWIQWIYGNDEADESANVRYHGGFFVPKDSADLTGNSIWTEGYIKRDDPKNDGKKINVDGFFAKDLWISFINQRHRYEVSKPGSNKVWLYAINDYGAAEKLTEELNKANPDQKQKYKNNKKSQFLVCIKGMEDSPMIITARNTAARRLSGQTGLIQVFDRTVMAAVSALLDKAGTNNKLPMRRFWVHVGISIDVKGKPEFQPTGNKGESKNLIVPTLWGVPAKPDADYIKSIHTGSANKDRFDDLYRETLDWSKAWSSIKAGSSPEAVEAKEEVATPSIDPETAAALNNM